VGLFDRVFGAGKEKDPAQAALREMDRALGLYRAKRFQEALAIADSLIAVGPSVPLSWRFRGECLFSLQRYAEAVAAFDKAAALGGKGTEDLFLWSALALHNGGQPEEAMQRLRSVLANPRLSPELRARTEEAIKQLQPTA
jgi:tetratricopeptide (TPR) repeat protein